MRKLIKKLCLAAFIAIFAWFAWVVVMPVAPTPMPYHLSIGPNQSLSSVAQRLNEDGVIRSEWVMIGLSRLAGTDRKIHSGLYVLSEPIALWQLLKRLDEGSPDQASVTILEGWRFKQFREQISKEKDLKHVTKDWDDARLLAELGAPQTEAEGLFFPSTYYFAPGSSDLDLYRRAYRTMQTKLEKAWDGRADNLPYHSPYDLLIMASLIEKETSKAEDRPMVASVFVNRQQIGMRLQTDPTVIYGMGNRYNGNITRADLRRDTPYNTYTRAGLPPTPIALPSEASLDAAAHPAQSQALYFVARGDGSSHFSETLNEHNQAVRKYILKKNDK